MLWTSLRSGVSAIAFSIGHLPRSLSSELVLTFDVNKIMHDSTQVRTFAQEHTVMLSCGGARCITKQACEVSSAYFELCNVTVNAMRQVFAALASPNLNIRGPSGSIEGSIIRLSKHIEKADCFRSSLKCLRATVVLVHQILRTLQFDLGKLFFFRIQSNPSLAKWVSWHDFSNKKRTWNQTRSVGQFIPELKPCSAKGWCDAFQHHPELGPVYDVLRESFLDIQEDFDKYIGNVEQNLITLPATEYFGQDRTGWFNMGLMGAGGWNQKLCNEAAPRLCSRLRMMIPIVRTHKWIYREQELLELFRQEPGSRLPIHHDGTNARVSTLMCIRGCEGAWIEVLGERRELAFGKLVTWEAGFMHRTGHDGCCEDRWVVSLAVSHPDYAMVHDKLQPPPSVAHAYLFAQSEGVQNESVPIATDVYSFSQGVAYT